MAYFLALLFLFYPTSHATETKLWLGEFSQHTLEGWESKAFKDTTRYELQTSAGVTHLHAESHDSASGLIKTQRIDLRHTPVLHWSWRIATRLPRLNEQSKAGDDYAARIYVILKGGWAFWQTQAINYVWSSNSAKDSVWPNAFAGKQAMMVAVQGPEAPLNTWQDEQRNIRTDLQQLTGTDSDYIDAIAIMTDTDNSNSAASADYGDIWFTQE